MFFCNLMQYAAMTFMAAYWGSQIVPLQRENDALRQELKAIRGDAEAKPQP